jgi:putative hydrolase of the HAD superfamily
MHATQSCNKSMAEPSAASGTGGAPLALFDLDDTLIDRTGNFERWARGFVAALGFAEDGPEFDWLVAADQSGSTDRHELFAATRERFALQPSVGDLVASYSNDIARRATCDARTVDALATLRASGWRICIVTNGFTTQQQAKIRNARLDALVDGWVVSESIGAAKPDPLPFDHAIAICGGTRAATWMIGDDPINDIEGAWKAGLLTIWIDHGRAWTHHRCTPTHVATNAGHACRVLLGL